MAITYNSAAYAYGPMEQGLITFAPRSRFNFRLEIELYDSRVPVLLFERISSATIPNITFDTQIANQYNKKRVVQTRMNYGTSTVVFYDTYDNDFVDNIVKPYIRNYYNNNRGLVLDDTNTNSEVVGIEDFTDDMGYNVTGSNNRYFIKKVILTILGEGNSSRKYELINAMITDISGDTLDYSDSQPVQFTVTFQPEKINILDINSDSPTEI